MKLTYRRSLPAARKIAEAFRKATKPFQGCKGLLERLMAVDPDDIPEDASRHATPYTRALVEFAAQHTSGAGMSAEGGDQDERRDPRAFTRLFLSKRPDYSRTSAGRSASMLEAWIMEKSGYLFSRFVETVLEGKGNRFLAIFEGKLQSEEMRKLRAGTGAFMGYDVLIEAGTSNGEEIFEFTILDCTARSVKQADREPEMQNAPPPAGGERDARAPSSMGKFESLLPTSRAEYDRVFEDGGLSADALEVVAGEEIFNTIVERDGQRVVRDENGVDWIESGARWLPDVDSIDESEGELEPRNYRVSDSERSCANCRFFRYSEDGGICALFDDYAVEGMMVCDEWAARQDGLVSEDDEEDEQEPPRVVHSDYNSWAIVEEDGHTLVMVGEQTWMVPQSFEEVMEVVEALGDMYPDDLDAERDLMAEATFRDFACEHGTVCARTEEHAEAFAGDSTVDERDEIVSANNEARLSEAADPLVRRLASESELTLEEAQRLWEAANEQVSESYPDVEQRSERWFSLCTGVFRSSLRAIGEADDDEEGDGKKP